MAVLKIRKRPPRVWNLYRDGVTQSFINKFLTCRHQCKLEYIDGWRPKLEPVWFEFGHCLHYVLSKCYETHQLPLPGQVLSLVKSYAEKREQDKLNKFKKIDYEQQELIYGIAEVLLPCYFAQYVDDFACNWVLNESNFEVPFVYSDGITISLRGRFDGGLFTPAGRFWVLDTKCLSLIDEDAISSMLPFDIQVMLYIYAASKHPASKGTWPTGIIYNIIRRPGQKRKVNESLPDFIKRIQSEIFKQPDYYFLRFNQMILRQEVDKWFNTQLTPILYEIRKWYDDGCISYTNPNALITKYGRCSMFDLITKGDTSRYYKITKPFTELDDAA